MPSPTTHQAGMPFAAKVTVTAVLITLIAGALYLALARAPALVLDLSGGIAALLCL